jgi:AcrR family transcriptional regulator
VRRKQPTNNARYPGDLRRALIDAAVAMVAENKGTGELTLRGVARRVGVSHAAPAKHFADKRELLAAVGAEGLRRLNHALADARRRAPQTPRDRLSATGVAYVRFALKRSSHFRVMFGPDVGKADSREFQDVAIEGFTAAKELVTDCAGRELPVEQVRQLVIVVWSVMHGLAELVINQQVPASVPGGPEELARTAMERLYRSLTDG